MYRVSQVLPTIVIGYYRLGFFKCSRIKETKCPFNHHIVQSTALIVIMLYSVYNTSCKYIYILHYVINTLTSLHGAYIVFRVLLYNIHNSSRLNNVKKKKVTRPFYILQIQFYFIHFNVCNTHQPHGNIYASTTAKILDIAYMCNVYICCKEQCVRDLCSSITIKRIYLKYLGIGIILLLSLLQYIQYTARASLSHLNSKADHRERG